MQEWLFWVWIAIGVVFAIVELFTGGFFALSLAVAAGLTAILAYLGLGFPGQLLTFGVVTALLFGIAQRAGKAMSKHPPEPLAGNRLVGKKGVVTHEIVSDGSRGMVRVDREEWRADGQEHDEIPEGTRVEIVAVEGAHLVVRPVDLGEPTAGASSESDTPTQP
jgi:membrane protein implicated in regulation of membrane protease activity